MLEHENRITVEKTELEEKALKLSTFIDDNELFEKLSDDEQNLLVSQFHIMKKYLDILNKRISLFTKGD